ncbi:hypothetical protein, partial [uncultured Clostridium sp.]|uniref:hypothetical protein n=1 Tax=uncultured Clostridium sp. TaxID=59620 RepID=UPI00258DEDFC
PAKNQCYCRLICHTIKHSNLYNFQRASNSMKNQAIFSYQLNRFFICTLFKFLYNKIPDYKENTKVPSL